MALDINYPVNNAEIFGVIGNDWTKLYTCLNWRGIYEKYRRNRKCENRDDKTANGYIGISKMNELGAFDLMNAQ